MRVRMLSAAADRAALVESLGPGDVLVASYGLLHTESELSEMSRIGSDAGLEVSLFVGPREEWGISAMSRAADGGCLAGGIRGLRQLRYAVEDVLRAVDCGIRGFLVERGTPGFSSSDHRRHTLLWLRQTGEKDRRAGAHLGQAGRQSDYHGRRRQSADR